MDLKQFEELPIMGILRGVKEEVIPALTETIISSGLKSVEITMNTPGAPKLIRDMKLLSGGKLFVGAGTVLNMDELELALMAGASFIVMPVLIPEVVKHCVENKIAVFPGAFSPQEIYNAWNCGASMVKVFPAKYFGPDYIKEVRGPFEKIKLLACGGVTALNVGDFFRSGASAVAFGGSVFSQERLEHKRFKDIENYIKDLIRGFYEK